MRPKFADSVCLTPQERRDLDTLLIGRQFLFVIIRGHWRLLTTADRALLRRLCMAAGHTVDQAADAKARTLCGFCGCGRGTLRLLDGLTGCCGLLRG